MVTPPQRAEQAKNFKTNQKRPGRSVAAASGFLRRGTGAVDGDVLSTCSYGHASGAITGVLRPRDGSRRDPLRTVAVFVVTKGTRHLGGARWIVEALWTSRRGTAAVGGFPSPFERFLFLISLEVYGASRGRRAEERGSFKRGLSPESW